MFIMESCSSSRWHRSHFIVTCFVHLKIIITTSVTAGGLYKYLAFFQWVCDQLRWFLHPCRYISACFQKFTFPLFPGLTLYENLVVHEFWMFSFNMCSCSASSGKVCVKLPQICCRTTWLNFNAYDYNKWWKHWWKCPCWN